MGRFSAKHFLILCIIDMSLAASHFRAERYTVTFDEDLDSDKQQQSEDVNNVFGNSNFDVSQFSGPLKSHLNLDNNQLFKVFRPSTDAVPFPKRKLGLNPQWVRGSDGEIATYAYQAGYLHKDNFVARAVYNNSLIPGKIISGQKEVYIGVGSKEIGVSTYETLGSSPSNLCWILPASLSTAKPMEGGHDECVLLMEIRLVTLGKVAQSTLDARAIKRFLEHFIQPVENW